MSKHDQSVLDYLQLRVLSCYQEALMLKQGKMPAPRMAILYPTYACNHRCIGCDYVDLNTTKRTMSEAEFKDIVDQLIDVGVKGIEFCGGGEPTLHPSLPKILDRLIESDIAFGILTNGTGLNEALRTRLVRHGSYCRVSIESASEKVFNSYKRPINTNAGFKAVVHNIKELVALRKKAGAKTHLQISIKYAIDKNNYHDVPAVIALAHRLQVDSVQYKLIRNVPSEIKDARLVKELQARIGRARARYPKLRVIADFSKSTLCGKCWISPIQLVIDPCGDVFICCYYRHRLKEHRLGNMLKHRLKDFWYSKEHWKKMAAIKRADCNKYDCRFHHYNDLMKHVVVDDIGQLSFV